MSIYGEVVGHSVQKNYDYGVPENDVDFYAYRITLTNEDGYVYEMPMNEVVDFCSQNNIKHVPVFYTGPAKDLFNIKVNETFHENFLLNLKSAFNLEKKCELCLNDVPAEGICVRNLSKPKQRALKFKSFIFLKKETADLDNGESNVEDNVEDSNNEDLEA